MKINVQILIGHLNNLWYTFTINYAYHKRTLI